jgi:hypothetical protein
MYIAGAPASGARKAPMQAKKKTKAKKKVSIVARTRSGQIRVRLPADATPEGRADAAHYVKTLDANRQIARGKALTPGTTHKVERDAKGKQILVRKRFSAI